MSLRPAKFHEKPSGHADCADGGADPLVRAGRPRPAAGPTISAPCRAPAGRRGRRPRTRGSAPPFPGLVFRPCPGPATSRLQCYHATETGGERVEREQVLAKLRERIVRFAASHLSRDVAEDLAQEVLLLLHEKYAHLESVEDLLPLSLQIVRFKIIG